MKIKSDFVTNSSSTSFVIMGCIVKKKEIIDANIELVKKELYLTDYNNKDINICINDIDFIFGETRLKHEFMPYNNNEVMIGHHYTDMGDDETMSQFKKRCKDDIEKLLKREVQVHHIEQSWEDD